VKELAFGTGILLHHDRACFEMRLTALLSMT
jgi:hypothetical protein